MTAKVSEKSVAHDDPNNRFVIMDFTTGDNRYRVYLLNPGDHFDRFGGSSAGLAVRKTASLIVSESGPGGRYDSEHKINAINTWESIFRAYRRSLGVTQ